MGKELVGKNIVGKRYRGQRSGGTERSAKKWDRSEASGLVTYPSKRDNPGAGTNVTVIEHGSSVTGTVRSTKIAIFGYRERAREGPYAPVSAHYEGFLCT